MTKDVLIMTLWWSGGLFKNWEYVVLSCVGTLLGLYLFKPIDLENPLNRLMSWGITWDAQDKRRRSFLQDCWLIIYKIEVSRWNCTQICTSQRSHFERKICYNLWFFQFFQRTTTNNVQDFCEQKCLPT